MIWAAYGDALGFITELCDKKGLKYRTYGKEHVSRLISWRRKLGGKFGVSIKIPEGCYSDDTQLRLSVCRSIKKDGKFDFETFSKIEVPVFLSYGLGVGRGTRAAGESLQKKTIQWNTNFFNTSVSKYINAGGNGAAMRIQPHVWVSTDKTADHELISEIMRNSIISHGHPIGWVGAVFHGLSLQHTLKKGCCPEPGDWLNLCKRTSQIIEVIYDDLALRDIWLPVWEKKTGKKIDRGVTEAIENLSHDINRLLNLTSKLNVNSYKPDIDFLAHLYQDSIQAIDAYNPAVRGSATKTALLASLVSYLFNNEPVAGIEICANTLGSDTDTIGTMAGAMLGSCCSIKPPQKVIDQEYMTSQAIRLNDIRFGRNVPQFGYPDLLNWNPPKSKLDYVGSDKNDLAISGLGIVKPYGETISQKTGRTDIHWRFASTFFGQTLLLRFRKNIEKLPDSNLPTLPFSDSKSRYLTEDRGKYPKLSENTPTQQKQKNLPFERKTIDEITDNLIKHGFLEKEVGEQLLRFAEDNDGVEKAIAFASIMVKAKKARLKKNT